MVTDDIGEALQVLRPVYDASDGVDGYVSVEVDPGLAADTDGTIESARQLHQVIDAPKVMVKIPAPAEGVPALSTMLAEGRSLTVTLIFSLERPPPVMEDYPPGHQTHITTGAADPTDSAS